MDIAFRSMVLNDYADIVSTQRRVSYLEWLTCQPDFLYRYSMEQLLDFDQELAELHVQVKLALSDSPDSVAIWREAEKINKAYYSRLSRLKQRAAFIFGGTPWFLTLTLNDYGLSLSDVYVRKQVTKYCKLVSDHRGYVANIDFGKENGRKHYHALVSNSIGILHNPWSDVMGFVYPELCYTGDDNKEALARYVAKLSNHAVKETAKQNYLIYSR